MDVPVALFVLLMQQWLFPTIVLSPRPCNEFKSVAGELITAIIVWTGSNTTPWFCEDAKMSRKVCKDRSYFFEESIAAQHLNQAAREQVPKN